MSKLFVGNLPKDVTESRLDAFFRAAQCHVESVKLVRDRYTGQPRGFAFVELSTSTDVKQVIQDRNGQCIGRNRLTVAEARPQRICGGNDGGRRYDSRPHRGHANRDCSAFSGNRAQITAVRPGSNSIIPESIFWPSTAAIAMIGRGLCSILSFLVDKAFSKKPTGQSLRGNLP
jgi:RNA recognition motif-containing protein